MMGFFSSLLSREPLRLKIKAFCLLATCLLATFSHVKHSMEWLGE
jgi:hypothetical protein